MTNDDLCPMSDLPPDQCALPCHANVALPAGAVPEVRRGDEPVGFPTSLTAPASEQRETRDTRKRPSRPPLPKAPCHYNPDVGEWMTAEHTRDCRATSCQGCRPCGEDHCALFGSCPRHVDNDSGINTCPEHIGETRDNITEVETLTALLFVELEHVGISSQVVNLAGPFADPDQLEARRDMVMRPDVARGWCDWPRTLPDIVLADDDHHPAAVFTRWERDLRRDYGQPRIPTEYAVFPLPARAHLNAMSRSADYFRRMLAGRFPHDEVFEQFARDIRRLRTFLENVLSDSRAPETGAPCPTCAEDLTRQLEGKSAPRLELHRGHWCDDPKCTREHDVKGTKDEWVCPLNPAHRWKEADYRLRVGAAYLAHATELTADQIRQEYDIPASTVRRWASITKRFVGGEWVEQPALLRASGRTSSGVKLYPVADVLALREQTQPKEKQA